MKKIAKKDTKKLSVNVATVRTLREGMTQEQLNHVAGGLMRTLEPSGTPANC